MFTKIKLVKKVHNFTTLKFNNLQFRNFCLNNNSNSNNSYKLINLSWHNNNYIAQVDLNRPEKGNAFNKQLWFELFNCFQFLNQHQTCRAIVLSASGKHFCTGIDLVDLSGLVSQLATKDDAARRSLLLQQTVKQLQKSVSIIEECSKPVIAAIHGACIGAGVDLIAACDVRYASEESIFSIKEVDVGLAADLGSLQRLPKIVSNISHLNELALSARNFNVNEAKQLGLISPIVCETQQHCIENAFKFANLLTSKSPIAVQGTKQALIHARDHSVQEGLNFITNWNMSMLQTNDIIELQQALKEKRLPNFNDL
eukprot:TRINITY_DN1907_c4_g1_i1.p1 TRINITY_DN1907_c4_g1~~TRINITY_DN1907_c4_g1_i1.p1  ORF type:complete len:324 (+),score=147.06 TRINITY_DN1907_c4_g1_i1:35-973(+)